MRGSLKGVLSRVNRLTGRVQPVNYVDWDDMVERLKSARTRPAGLVAPKLSDEGRASLLAQVSAMRGY